MRPFRLAVILLVTSVPVSAQQSQTLQDPEAIEGPWETVGPSGIDGIFLTIESNHVNRGRIIGRDGRQQVQIVDPSSEIAWQTTDILVYHRQAGRQTEGHFSPAPDFDGLHLKIHYAGSNFGYPGPFDLDVTFSTAEQRWIGTSSREGEPAAVVLERPHLTEGVAANPFVGDWEGQADPNEHGATSGTLHVRQSRDGALTAWLDRGVGGGLDQRNGEPLTITTDQTAIKLDLDTVMCCAAPFNGVLSDDHQTITGVWFAPGMPGLQAPKRFRRMPSGAL